MVNNLLQLISASSTNQGLVSVNALLLRLHGFFYISQFHFEHVKIYHRTCY